MSKTEIIDLRQEQVIAKMIYDPEYREYATSFLQIQDFPTAKFRKVYRELKKLIAQNESVDSLILTERVGVDSVPTEDILSPKTDYESLARRIHEDGNRYRVQVLLAEFLDKADTQGFNFNEELDELRKKMDLPLGMDLGGLVGHEAFEQFVENLSRSHEPVGKTGIRKLDNLLQGFEQGHVYTIIAGSGVGKTMLGVQAFVNSINEGTACMYLSNEMGANEIVSRILARDTNESSLDIRRNKFGLNDEKINRAIGKWADKFSDTGSIVLDKAHDPTKALKAIRYYAMKNNIKLVVVDHIHNFSGGSDLYSKISQMSHDLQAVAQEMNIAMIILGQISLESQKSRDIEHMTGKGAKDLEEVSNVVIALKRKKVELQGRSLDKTEDPTYMQIIVSKNRDGMTGSTAGRVSFPSMVISQEHEY